MASDLQLAELMAARVCHDLVGPIGAVANGIELLGEGGAGSDPEVTGLIAASARQATNRLQWFRVAFGSGASLPAASIFAESRRLAAGLFDERVKLDWPEPDAAAEGAASRVAAKLVLNLSLVAIECLPRGGKVQIRTLPAPAGVTITAAALGAGARLPDDLQAALRDNAALGDLTPKSVPAYLVARLAAQAGSRVVVRPTADRVEFTVGLPAGSQT